MAAATYTVLPGDSLSSISKKIYGSFNKVDELATVNNIANKNVITPGQKLILPEVEDAEVIEDDEPTTGKAGKYIAWGLLAVGAYFGGKYVYNNYIKKKKTTLTGPVKKKRSKRRK